MDNIHYNSRKRDPSALTVNCVSDYMASSDTVTKTTQEYIKTVLRNKVRNTKRNQENVSPSIRILHSLALVGHRFTIIRPQPRPLDAQSVHVRWRSRSISARQVSMMEMIGDSLSISAFRPMVIFHCLPALAIRLSCASPSSALGFAFRKVGDSVAFAAAVM